MDRETTLRMIAAVALSFGAIVVWRMFIAPVPPVEPAARPPVVEQPLETGSATAAGDVPVGQDAAGQVDSDAQAPVPAAVEVISGEAGAAPIEVVTPGLDIQFTPRGARILSLKLNEFDDDPSDASAGVVDLVSPNARRLDLLPLTIAVPGDEALTSRINEAWYVAEEPNVSDEEREREGLPEGARRLDFRWADASGVEVRKRIWIPADGRYLLRVEWSATQAGRPIDGARLTWGPGIWRETDADSSNRYAYRGHAVVSGVTGVERYRPEKLSADLLFDAGTPVRWLALDTQYFAVALVSKSPDSGAVRIVPAQAADTPPQLLLETASRSVTVFAGPKSDGLLHEIDAEIGAGLAGLVDWGFFWFLARPMYVVLDYIHTLLGNWGWAIVVLTFFIKVAFYPLTQRAMVNMRRTQEKMGGLQPKLRKIKEKYRDKKDMESRRKMQEDMMALYKSEGVNPMAPVAGCLPLLLQLPVLYGMYGVLTVALELRGAPYFGWIRDLSSYDPYFVTPLVMGVTMLLQQLMSLTRVEDPQQKAQQRMMLLMPVMFTFFFLRLPSGLVLYWLTNNVLGIAQQALINRQASRATEDKSGGSSGKGTS